jgi:hypothetical protein
MYLYSVLVHSGLQGERNKVNEDLRRYKAIGLILLTQTIFGKMLKI